MAKYEFRIEITPPDADEGPGDIDPTLDEVKTGIYAGVQAAFPEAEIRVYGGNRPDID
jgi:hypothetical protein